MRRPRLMTSTGGDVLDVYEAGALERFLDTEIFGRT